MKGAECSRPDVMPDFPDYMETLAYPFGFPKRLRFAMQAADPQPLYGIVRECETASDEAGYEGFMRRVVIEERTPWPH